MASCLLHLQTPPAVVLTDGVVNTGVVTRTACVSFTYVVSAFTVLTLDVAVTPSPVVPFSATLRIYRASPLQEVVSFAINEYAQVLSKELAAGTYYVCVETQGLTALQTTILASSTQYQGFASLAAPQSSGEHLAVTLTQPRRPQACQTTLFYEITEGSLPPGLRMTSLGQIRGVLPENDCLEDNAALPPSQTWGQEIEGVTWPWGRQWRFKVKVWPEGTPDVSKEEWFCVASHNDWSRDRDAFLSQAPFTSFSYERVETRNDAIVQTCPSPSVDAEFSPQQIDRGETENTREIGVSVVPTICPSCDDAAATRMVVGIPAGVARWGDEGFVAWVDAALVSTATPAALLGWYTALKASPLYAALAARPDVVKAEWKDSYLEVRDYSGDPLTVYTSARDASRQHLPWGSWGRDGVAMTINMV